MDANPKNITYVAKKKSADTLEIIQVHTLWRHGGSYLRLVKHLFKNTLLLCSIVMKYYDYESYAVKRFLSRARSARRCLMIRTGTTLDQEGREDRK